MNKLKDLLTKDNCYSIGIRRCDHGSGLLFEGNYSEFSVMPISKNYWYADPIVFSYNGIDYLFCEVFDRKTDLGFIGVTVLDGIHPKEPKKALDIGTHLSYPCVFEINGDVYMIPETTTKLSVELYKATSFPYKWEYVTEILHDDEYADSTYFADESRKLLLLFRQFEGNGSITQLQVKNADRIFEGVLSDYPYEEYDFSNQSRGGGKLFRYKDKLIRPAQDCSTEYGYALNFLEVQIDDKRYIEKAFSKVCPEQIKADIKKRIIGIHTYAITDEYEIIDVKFDDPVLRYQIRRVFRYFKRTVLNK